MRYGNANTFRQALEDRLKQQAQRQEIDVNRLRKFVTFDRLFARLMANYPEGWVLKGAVALEFRYPGSFRSTRDADLGSWGGQSLDMRLIESTDLEDYFQFEVETTAALDKLSDAVAVRYRVHSYLARRRFETVTVDVGYGAAPYHPPSLVPGTDLLSFAGIDQLEIPTLSLEQHVAEKIHAYTRVYEGGRRSTRAKDLVDLVVIQGRSVFSASRLAEAIHSTFDERELQVLPAELPPPPEQWRRTYRELARGADVSGDLLDGFRLASQFLNPVLAGDLPDDGTWNPRNATWHH